MNESTLFVLLAAAALGTYLLRASFLTLVPANRLPDWARRGLEFVPPAVLAALAAPAILPSSAAIGGTEALARPIAGLVAVVVGLLSRNIFLTIAAGMSALWTVSAL
jgi:branched chain amino acid efflux pump